MHRIIQWSSGNVGKGILRGIAERDDCELVGLYVYAPDKVGQDAGSIAGVEPMGVAATQDIDALLASGADVVLHTPLPSLVHGDDPDADLRTICRLLASGLDVITTVGYMYPRAHGAEVVDRLEAACAEGRSTFHSTGLNPGWMGDVLPLAMTGLSCRVDAIRVTEITNFEFYPSPEIMFDMMGFGRTEEEFERHAARHAHWLTGLFRENVLMIADGIGMPVTDITATTTRVLADADLDVAAGRVARGTVAGQRWKWAGLVAGEERVVHETVWRMHGSVAPDWPDGDHRIEIAGTPGMQLKIGARWIDDGLLATGMHALNAVPCVRDADSGIRTLLDLPMILGRAHA